MRMDDWIKEKIGLDEQVALTRKNIEEYQFEKLKETLSFVKSNSKFYSDKYKNNSVEELTVLKDLEHLPFTTVEELREHGMEMLCVPQDEVSRIVTLDTSGTTGKPKRVFYTESDQELTKDFFNRGMRNLVDETDIVMIMLPFVRPGSVGDLLATGLARLGAGVVKYGLLRQGTPQQEEEFLKELSKQLIDEKITCIVGAPTQVSFLAEQTQKLGLNKNFIKSVLLSVEYVSKDARDKIKEAWNCNIFEHYGMTEMGLGGSVSCIGFEGSHPREADLYFEIIDPETGKVVPDGEFGEVVFTTLTRTAMPFIRYRTGDICRWLTEPCSCGSILKRLDRVGDRKLTKGIL